MRRSGHADGNKGKPRAVAARVCQMQSLWVPVTRSDTTRCSPRHWATAQDVQRGSDVTPAGTQPVPQKEAQEQVEKAAKNLKAVHGRPASAATAVAAAATVPTAAPRPTLMSGLGGLHTGPGNDGLGGSGRPPLYPRSDADRRMQQQGGVADGMTDVATAASGAGPWSGGVRRDPRRAQSH